MMKHKAVPNTDNFPNRNMMQDGGNNNDAYIKYMVKDVLKDNFYKEFKNIVELSKKFNHISINVESAGTLGRPIGKFRGKKDYIYQTIRVNVDLFNIFKVGISLCDEFGNKPDNTFSTWQLHMKVDPENEMVPSEFLDFLDAASTIPETMSTQLKNTGIDLNEFAVRLTDSGLLFNANNTWIAHSGGYDFAYLLRLITDKPLPNNKLEFFSQLNFYFPNYYDLDLINQRLNYQIFMVSGMKDDMFLPPQHLEMLADGLQIQQLPHYKTTGGVSLLILITYNHLCSLTKKKFPDEKDFSYIKNQLSAISMDNDFSNINKNTQNNTQFNQQHNMGQQAPNYQQQPNLNMMMQQQHGMMMNGGIPPGMNVPQGGRVMPPPSGNVSNSSGSASMVNHLQTLQMQHNNKAQQWK